MIKFNLLRDRAAKAAKGTETEINYDTTFETKVGGDSTGSRDMLTKIVVLALLTGVLMMYESYNIGELRTKVAQGNAEKKRVETELAQKKPIEAKARELQKQIQDIETRIKAIKDLSKVRLREIKAIDYLQNIIPEKLWFTLLEFDGNSLKIEGGTTSDDQLNRFLDDMESKSIFKNVILLRSIEQKNKEGTIKVFTITSTVGSVD